MRRSIALAGLAFGASFIWTGCSTVSSEHASTAGGVAGSVASSIAGATGLGWGGTTAIGYGVQAVTLVAVHVLATHEASQQQKEIAAQRAKAIYAEMPPAEQKQVQKKRYIAVNTKRDERIQGEKAVMVFDTKTEQVVGNKVYDVEKAPPVGSTAKFDTVSATYVGS